MPLLLPILILITGIAQQTEFSVDPVWFRNQALSANLPDLANFRLAKEDPLRGHIVIELSVDASGTVIKAEVLEADSPALGDLLRKALGNWKFNQAKDSLVLPKDSKLDYPTRKGRCIFNYRTENGSVELDDIVLNELQRLKEKRKMLEEQGIVPKAIQ